jgi:tetratricopeptide (TPR) repeat protein
MANETSIPAGGPSQQFGVLLQRLLGSQQWDRALAAARDWLAQDPENAEAHQGAALALVNMGKNAEAQAHAEKVLALRPGNGFAHRLASIAYARQGKNQDAEKHIQRAIELQPENATHWYQLAHMRYQQGALDAAEKYAKRAQELQPWDADIMNLVAICQRGNPAAQRQQYLRALEVDPENSTVHSNLGLYYLNTDRNLAEAEASFRRALQSNPANEAAQRNLFATLRLRDPLYRVLTLPRNLIYKTSWARRDRTVIMRIGLFILWMAIGRYILIVFAVWLMFVWPLVKVYEYLTLSDIRAKAGVIGARRGGWQGLHRWPLPARLGVFAAMILAFWGGLYALYACSILPLEWIAAVAILMLVAWYAAMYFRWGKRAWRRAAAKRADKKIRAATGAPDSAGEAGPYR